MKKYRVNVNGNEYEIGLELIDESEVKSAAPVKAAAPTPSAAPAGGEKITSPMPGTILSVNVSNGDTVKKGQVLMILEAMKMENEIMSPIDGTIASVNASKGATVESGALLCVIK
ncbi:MAG: biotin/lipoyl-binding protein [Cellulosilyticum sp.]|nr:biotin/lipoyl-binding protein [Cellulosilyticum sp.]